MIGKLQYCLSAALVLLVMTLQWVPAELDPQGLERSTGGCDSGLCVKYNSAPCPTGGDACGGYSQCVPSDLGPFICTPQLYCGDPGCGGVISGGTCR